MMHVGPINRGVSKGHKLVRVVWSPPLDVSWHG